MPENYTEIVQFEWRTGGASGPDTASQKMQESLDRLSASITAIGENARTTFGTSFSASLNPAIASVNALNTSLAETLRLLGEINGIPPINPLGGGSPPPPPNNPTQPGAFPDTVVGTQGPYTFYASGNIKGPGGRWVSPAEVPPITPATSAAIGGYIGATASNTTFSGDMFPGAGPTGPGRLSLNTPEFLAGGFAYQFPTEYLSGPSRRPYSKPVLSNLGFFGENDPRYENISFPEPQTSGYGTLSPEEFDRLQEETLRQLMAGGTPPGWMVAGRQYQAPRLSNWGVGGIPTSQRLSDEWQRSSEFFGSMGLGDFGGPYDLQSWRRLPGNTYQAPRLSNWGAEGISSNVRLGDQWSNGLANFTNAYSDLASQARDLSNITDLLKEFSRLRYGGMAREGLIGNEIGFPIQTGWTSPIYGSGQTIGGFLNGPQPQYIPGAGSTFGMSGGLWGMPGAGGGATINNGGAFNPFAYNFSAGTYASGMGMGGTGIPGGFGGINATQFSWGGGGIIPGGGGGLGPPWIRGGWQLGQQGFGKQLPDDLDEITTGFDRATQATGMFMRSLERVATYSIIFAGFGAAAATIKGLADEMIRFSDIQARVGFISGQAPETTKAQFAEAAQYGIGPAQAGAGILTGAQLGSTKEQQTQAQQLALVFGADQYSRALIELNQTQIRADAVGLKHVDTMNFIAESYKTLPGTMADYFNALQMGIQMHGQFGVSAESMGLAIERVARTTNQGVGEIGTLYQSVLSKLQTPAAQKDLEQAFQIKPGTIEEILPQVLDTYKQLAAVGDTAGIQKLMEAIQGGGIGGYARIQSMSVAFKELIAAQEAGIPVLANWDRAFAEVSNSQQVRINRLTAAWQNFLLALGSGIPGQKVTGLLESGISILSGSANIVENTGQAVRVASTDMGGAGERVAKYQEEHPLSFIDFMRGIPGMPFSSPETLGKLVDNISGLIDAIRGGTTGGYEIGRRPGPIGIGEAPVTTGFGLRIPQSVLNPYPAPMENFGGLQTMPQQVGLEQYRRMIAQQETALKIAGVPVEDKNYEILSKSGDLLGQILADSNAIRLTNERIAQNTSTFGGTPPSGVTAANYQEFQSRVTAEDAKLKAAGITLSDPKTVVFQDKSTDALFKIVGSNEAIQFATQQMASNLPSFSGILPKGEDLVKIQARINAIDSTGMVGAAGLDTAQVQKVFWDPVTQTLKAIHGTETAIQIATEEAAKLLQQQITGTFNVPAGGEAVVAFFALQQGFVPGGAGARGDGSGSSAALNGSANALSFSASGLNTAAAALLAAANALGGPQGDILRYIAAHGSTYAPQGAAAQGISGYIQAHQQAMAGGSSVPFRTPQTSNYPGVAVSHPPLPQSNIHQQANAFERDRERLYQFMNSGRTSAQGSGGGNTSLSVNNAIRINIDGRQIAYYMNRKTYRQFESVRNSISGVPNSVVTL